MFKFNFSEENQEKNETEESKVHEWLQAKEILLEEVELLEEICTFGSPKTTNFNGGCLQIKHLCADTVSKWLKSKKFESGVFEVADKNHSDLIPAVYEGGLKIWECTYDLVSYVIKENIDLNDKNVLDLGCGAGIVGITALIKESNVCFQDYNEEVIRNITIPNVCLNIKQEKATSKCKFYCGDWSSFAQLIDASCGKFDYIFTSETIYNPNNYNKLHSLFKKLLKKDGIIFLAAKSYYFGVGGGIQQFVKVIEENNTFRSECVWECPLGVKRQILKTTFTNGRL